MISQAEASTMYIVFVLLLVMLVSVKTRKLDFTGAVAGGLTGFFVFKGAGYTGILLIGLFFVMGVAATSWRMDIKQRTGAAESNNGRRTAQQVMANGGIAAIAGAAAWLHPGYAGILRLILAASLASAASDTLSSELGIVYGRNFYNILTLKKEKRGENGAVSTIGTLLGIAGSAVIAAAYCFTYGNLLDFLRIIIAATAGNLADSVLGAGPERKHYIGNNAVNFLNTGVAALTVYLLQLI